MDNGYPKLIKDSWHGIPDHIDSVFEWGNKIFFFKGKKSLSKCLKTQIIESLF